MYIEADGEQITGQILQSTVRTSLEPIPFTFEAWIELNESNQDKLLEGKELKVGRYKEKVTIVYAKNQKARYLQDEKIPTARKITALQTSTHKVGFRRSRAIILENTSMSQAYQACGARVNISKDFIIPKFYVLQGSIPTVEVAKSTEEGGGVIRWDAKSGSVEFSRIIDLFKQKPLDVKLHDGQTRKSGFIERHELPSYVSVDNAGAVVLGDTTKTRAVEFSPEKTVKHLYNMTHPLLNAKEVPASYSDTINAGDLLKINDNLNMVVITAAHSTKVTAANVMDMQSRFWLGVRG